MVLAKIIVFVAILLSIPLLSDAKYIIKSKLHISNVEDIMLIPIKIKQISMDPQLSELRAKIDSLDAELLKVLSKRMDIVKKVGQYKKAKHMSIYQPKRYKELLNIRLKLAEKLGLNKGFITKLFDLIHNESLNTQNILNK